MRTPILRTCAAAVALAGLVAGGSAQTIHHVDADALGGAADGSSWADAFLDLTVALAAAAPGDTVLLAEGVYVPGGLREEYFPVGPDVTLRGGYAGHGAPDPDARDIALYESVLSGDLLGDDLPGFVNRTDNAYHVLIPIPAGAGFLALDGLTVRGGHADGAEYVSGSGAGVYGNHADLVLRDCTFTDNFARVYGAGVFAIEGSADIQRCAFTANRIESVFDVFINAHGGAGLAGSGPLTTLLGCEFVDNVVVHGALPHIGAYGGAAFLSGDVVRIDHCRFAGNEVDGLLGETGLGGGLALWVFEQGRIADSVFVDNLLRAPAPTGVEGGGGAWVVGPVRVAATRFLGNAAPDSCGGGLVFHEIVDAPSQWLALDGCEFSGNTARDGGGVHSAVTFPHEIANCSFSLNAATGTAGGALLDDVMRVSNSVFWGNTDAGGGDETAQVDTTNATLPELRWSLVQGYTGAFPGGDCLDADPLFVDADGVDDVAGTPDDDLRVQAGSPAIDSASNALILDDLADLDGDGSSDEPAPLDVAGLARRADDPLTPDGGSGSAPIVDRGAHEFASSLPDERWTDLGFALAGSAGLPRLAASGTLTAFTAYRLELTDARPHTTCVLVIGTSLLGAAFKGGTLVPATDIMVFGLPTGPTGALAFSAPWADAEYPGVSLWWQYWIDDPLGVWGWAASNAVVGTTPTP